LLKALKTGVSNVIYGNVWGANGKGGKAVVGKMFSIRNLLPVELGNFSVIRRLKMNLDQRLNSHFIFRGWAMMSKVNAFLVLFLF